MPIVRDPNAHAQHDLDDLRERAAVLECSAEIADLYLAAGLDVPEHVLGEVTELSAIRYTLARRTGALTEADEREQHATVHAVFGQREFAASVDAIGGEAA